MKVPYGEGTASHIGSESCGCIRKDTVEALTGVRAGWVSSLSPTISSRPTEAAVAPSAEQPFTHRTPHLPLKMTDG